MRAIWSGHITFGLISIPVSIYSAVEASEHVSFRLLHRKDHAPIKFKKFCSKEDKEVPNDEIVKGFEVSRGEYSLVEKEELKEVEKEVAGEADHDIEVLQFVELGALNPLSFETPYYAAPRKGGEKAYGVLRDALLETERVGIIRFALRTRPMLGALIPGPKAIALETLRPFEELRTPKDLPIAASTKKSAEVKMAKMLIDQMSAEAWDPTAHPNEYKKALEKLLASKRRFPVAAPSARGGKAAENVVDLMDALKKSLGQSMGAGRPGARRSHARRAGAA
jgi:DNA end-binding protein Ku